MPATPSSKQALTPDSFMAQQQASALTPDSFMAQQPSEGTPGYHGITTTGREMAASAGGAPLPKVTKSTNPKLAAAMPGADMPEYVGATTAGAAGAMGGEALMETPIVGPALRWAAKKIAPIAVPALASEAIHQAKDLPIIGPVVQHIPFAEMLPWMMGGGKGERGKLSESFGKDAGAPLPEMPAEIKQASGLRTGGLSAPEPAAALESIPVKSGSIAASFKDPGAALPAKPEPALFQARGLSTGGSAPPEPSAPLGTIPVKSGAIAKAVNPAASAEVAPGFQRGSLQTLLDRSLGAKQLDPKVPLRNQMDVASPAARPAAPSADLPEGHTAIESSALRSYKYDPATQEFEANFKGGSTPVRYGGVSPEQFKYFEEAESKGKAFQAIKNSGTPVAKRINGKWQPIKASASQ